MKRKEISTFFCLPVQPAFLIGTCNEDGSPNFAPITWISKTCPDPETNIYIITMNGKKRTKENVLRTGQLSFNLVSREMLPLVDYFGAHSGLDGEKGLTGASISPALTIHAPTLDISPAVCECEVVHTVELGTCHTFFCRINRMEIAEHVEPIDNWGIDLTQIDALIYSGEYHAIGQHLGAIGDFLPKESE